MAGCHIDSVWMGPAEQAMFDHVRAGNIQEVKNRLDAGRDVNAQDEPGCTPLHLIAGSFDQPKACEMIELLARNGARVNDVNRNGQTALELAVSDGRERIATCLRQQSGKTGELKADRKSLDRPKQDAY